jgi:hypothetical protein
MQTPTSITVEKFPRGFAEPLERSEFRPVLLKLEGNDIFDAGIRDYGEFFVGLDYGWELITEQSVPFDDRPGEVVVAERFSNAVQLKWRPLDR